MTEGEAQASAAPVEAGVPGYKLYPLKHMLWGTWLGGPLAATWMIATNFKRLGQTRKRDVTLIVGAALVMALLERFPIVVWAGAALLGWIAGEVIVKDPLIAGLFEPGLAHKLHYAGAIIGALLVVTLGVAVRHFCRKPSRVGSS